jgi:hypothetical protein
MEQISQIPLLDNILIVNPEHNMCANTGVIYLGLIWSIIGKFILRLNLVSVKTKQHKLF